MEEEAKAQSFVRDRTKGSAAEGKAEMVGMVKQGNAPKLDAQSVIFFADGRKRPVYPSLKIAYAERDGSGSPEFKTMIVHSRPLPPLTMAIETQTAYCIPEKPNEAQ